MLLSIPSYAEEILIAAAADLKFAMDEVIKDFKVANPSDKISVVYGSSGTFLLQIQNGAPYDLYFSADIDFPKKLQSMKLTSSEVKPYAFGRLVLWSNQVDASKMTLRDLVDKSISRIAIANPQHAPYGKRASEALQAVNAYDAVKEKLVLAENIGQASQWVKTGNAQVGIIALSLALSSEMQGQGKYSLIDEKLHQRLEQGFVITKHAEKSSLAKRFADNMSSMKTRSVMERYGFVIPK
ncbi:MAG TPA: molybdate ABC transporter substrate-binding protein [Limnohabitans sp.]|jgi:molybdate transport system substrate-binding protein|nr:molybdate ABC transporter substrate-binding protein [Limnohabitans sp.]